MVAAHGAASGSPSPQHGDTALRYELFIDETAPSPNKSMRLHWRSRKRLWDRWAWLVRASYLPPATPLLRAAVRIARYGIKPLDPDNLVGAQKPLIDALVINGYIADDSAKHIQLSVTDEERPKGVAAFTMILVEAMADG